MPLKAKYGARFLSFLYFCTKMYYIKIHIFINFTKLSVLPIYTEALQTKRGKHTLREFMLKKSRFSLY